MAWRERSPALSVEVTKESLIFLGRAFGGNIIDWHIRAATTGALQSSKSLSQICSGRIHKGAGSFATPLLDGDEVRGYVEALDAPNGLPLSKEPFLSLCRVHLIAKRPRGFSEVPVTILEAGDSKMEVLHLRLHHDRLRPYKSVKGFDISRIATNNFETCHQNSFGPTHSTEGIARRSCQLTAAANVRFYVVAREVLGGDKERDPIVTRNSHFKFSARA